MMRYEVWEKLAHKYNRLWVQKYSLGPTRREILKIALPMLEENPNLKILDIGCGTGQLIGEISSQYKELYYLGIDVAKNMIEIAKSNNKEKNIEFRVCPVENFTCQEKYDLIICSHSFPYFPNKEETLKKIAALCNPHGQVIIVNSSTNNLKDLIINFFLKATTSKARYLSIKEMKKLFQAARLKVKKIKIIRERFYMPTIALFHLEVQL